MFKLTILLVLISTTISTPVDPIPIVSEEIVVEHDGKFHFNFESADGTKVHEEGNVKAIDKDHVVETVQGGWQYNSPDGQSISVQYIADENGFQPVGDVIPKVPEAISRALKYIEEHPQKEETVGVVKKY